MASTNNTCDSSSSEDESPSPSWTVHSWTNQMGVYENECTAWNVIAADAADASSSGACAGCVTRISNQGDNRGCKDCDEYWDMPDLIIEEHDLIVNDDVNDDDNDDDDNKSYCEGCDLLDAGLGGENQMGHSCMGY